MGGRGAHRRRGRTYADIATVAVPGADLDAVGAIGAALHLSLGGVVLFDTGQATLKPDARRALEAVAARITDAGQSTVLVEGHTDSAGATRTIKRWRKRVRAPSARSGRRSRA